MVRWHRAGFQLYWRLISRVRKPLGRRPVTKEIRELIFKMMAENPTWRAPRTLRRLAHARLQGFAAQRLPLDAACSRSPDSGQRWLTFLRNHREAIAAMDFFSVPTITFGVLYVFFIIGHDRRRILHSYVTRHPTSEWIVQQLRQALPYDSAPRCLILDHDRQYGADLPAAIRSMGIKPVRTAVACPWQNGIAERWVGSCRRELLDHVIALDESHLKHLLSSYLAYYHQDRTHCGLDKQTPEKRTRCQARGEVLMWPQVGGLHHRYARTA
ncbi:MAG: transposase [Acidobacteriales bacterium]|nr:transposase [Terriglobales bacterium]